MWPVDEVHQYIVICVALHERIWLKIFYTIAICIRILSKYFCEFRRPPSMVFGGAIEVDRGHVTQSNSTPGVSTKSNLHHHHHHTPPGPPPPPFSRREGRPSCSNASRTAHRSHMLPRPNPSPATALLTPKHERRRVGTTREAHK
jgi:hypothetical protein